MRYRVVDSLTFFKRLKEYNLLVHQQLSNSFSKTSEHQRSDDDIEILQFQFGQLRHYTYVLCFQDLAWIDENEITYFRSWINKAEDSLFLDVGDIPTYSYLDDSKMNIWVTGELSRGAHCFHYGHYSIDFLPCVSYCSKHLTGDKYRYIVDSQYDWQESLDSVSGISYNKICLERHKPTSYPSVCLHRIKTLVFSYDLNSDFESYRISVFKAIYDSRPQGEALHDCTSWRQVSSKTPAIFLSRHGIPNPRILNEIDVFRSIQDIFPSSLYLKPELFSPESLINFVDDVKPIIISAGNSALHPLFRYCKMPPLCFLIVPFTNSQINSNALGEYLTVASSLQYEHVKAISCTQYIQGDSGVDGDWNSSMLIDPEFLSSQIKRHLRAYSEERPTV